MDMIFSFQGEFRHKHVNIPSVALKSQTHTSHPLAEVLNHVLDDKFPKASR